MLCLPFFFLLMLHGVRAWMWMAVPLLLFALEMLCRIGFICSGRGRTHIISMNSLPNQVVRLRIRRPQDFEFQCGDYLYVNIPDVARFEWHPFTISSAPEDDGNIMKTIWPIITFKKFKKMNETVQII